jgi:3-oxoacyl-[acyl-carrier-protein] synthase II
MPFVTGLGWVTAGNMGCGRERHSFHMACGSLPSLTRKSVTDKPFPHFGRMDGFSKLGLAGIAFALKDAGLHEWTERRPIGIIASTVYGCLQTDVDYYGTVMQDNGLPPSPTLFSYTLPNCFLGETASHFGTTGLSYVIHDSDFASLSSLKALLLNMRLHAFEKALAGIVDEPCPLDSPYLSRTEPGAAFVMVEKTPHSAQSPYGHVTLKESGEVLLNGKKQDTLIHLIQACLADLRGGRSRDC